jgi:FXSXX-COOH protein
VVKNLDIASEHVPTALSSDIPDLRDVPLDGIDVALTSTLSRVVEQTDQSLDVAAFNSSI